MAKVKTALDLQNDAIRNVCDAIADHMISSNSKSNGEAFRSFTYVGKTVTAADRADLDVAKQFNELAHGNFLDESLPCAEKNLIVALLQKNAIKVFVTAAAEHEQEQKKLAKEKELLARAKQVANDPVVKRTRKGRMTNELDGAAELIATVAPHSVEPVKVVEVVHVDPIVVKQTDQRVDNKISSALSSLSDLEDSEPTL